MPAPLGGAGQGAAFNFQDGRGNRRARVFGSERFRRKFVRTLDGLRAELGFRIVGYVLMPEHCDLLIWPSEGADPSKIMQSLKERTPSSF